MLTPMGDAVAMMGAGVAEVSETMSVGVAASVGVATSVGVAVGSAGGVAIVPVELRLGSLGIVVVVVIRSALAPASG
jgi:hypothetical protein